MSTSLLYHAFGVRDYQYVKTEYKLSKKEVKGLRKFLLLMKNWTGRIGYKQCWDCFGGKRQWERFKGHDIIITAEEYQRGGYDPRTFKKTKNKARLYAINPLIIGKYV